MTAAADVPGYDTASPTMRTILSRLVRLGPVHRIGPGRWLATCPCCGEPDGAEFADVWQRAQVAGRETIQ